MGRAIDANGSQWVRSFFSHCDQAEAVREYTESGSNAQQAPHKQSELKNAPNKAMRYCPTLIRPS
jgi:hypothetical protein